MPRNDANGAAGEAKNAFRNPDGTSSRDAVRLDPEALRDFFLQQDFHVVGNVTQEWRHAHVRLEKNGKALFAKVASTQGIGYKTRNEISWNEQMHDRIPRNMGWIIPPIYETGEYQGLPYYVTAFYPGKLVATKDTVNTEELRQRLQDIVRVLHFFLTLDGISFRADNDDTGVEDRLGRFKKNTTEWRNAVPSAGLDEVLAIALTIQETYAPAVNHGDFVPWHMLEHGNECVLIDAEHASSLKPRFYDAAYFFHRLYTSAETPTLAEDFLHMFYDRLSPDSKKSFYEQFRPVLASRIVGGYFDTQHDHVLDLQYHNQLRDKLLHERVI